MLPLFGSPRHLLARGRSVRRALPALVCLFAHLGMGSAQAELHFGGREWSAQGEVREEQGEDGKKILRLRNGQVELLDLEMESGTLRFDARAMPGRYFFGVGFRVRGETRENFYLRPHNTGRFDALQYTPVFEGVTGWQLYPEYNALFEIPLDRWFQVELRIRGPRFEVFLDGSEEPVMSIPVLEGGKAKGKILLWSNVPPGIPEEVFPVALSSFELRHDDTSYPYPERSPPPEDSGWISAWAVSSIFESTGPLELPSQDLDWRMVQADEKGRVNFGRVAEKGSASRGTRLARAVLVSDAPRTLPLGFGFSDMATIFLNGQPVFRGNNTYRTRSQRYLGVMGSDNDVLFLDLKPGPNELLFAVTEAFGGWGVTARLFEAEGVKAHGEAPTGPAKGATNER